MVVTMNTRQTARLVMIIDYGMGNMRSIEKALAALKADFIISGAREDLRKATHIILPGVGYFAEGMKNLQKLDIISALSEEVLGKNKFLLGICLGMQILFNTSEEGGLIPGLGYINGDIRRFRFENGSSLKVPHIGWNEVYSTDMGNVVVLKDIEPATNFYFIHSYHAVLHEEIPHACTDYGYPFVSVVQKNTVFGTQFHPEKSQKKGLALLNNFISL